MRLARKNLISPTKRIDKAIELLVHYNLTLLEIAYQLNYRSVDELKNQFINWVGHSPEDFKQLIFGDREQEIGALSRV